MSATAAVNTKIERVTEAFEELIISVSTGEGSDQRKAARKELRNALAEFLQPALRLIPPATLENAPMEK
jgi:hypothetical protein